MKCPACGSNLKHKNVADLEVDVCDGGCGGIWFDKFELIKVDEKHEHLGESLLDIDINPNSNVNFESERHCPKCSNRGLKRKFRSVEHKIELDECYECGGVWLDQGELGLIRSQFETIEDRTKAAQDFFAKKFGGDLEEMQREGKEAAARAKKFANAFKFICPSYYMKGDQDWGAF